MSKVEELREKVEVAIFHVEDNESMYLAIGMLDSLIAAAREEGAERERERAYDYGLYLDNTSSVPSLAPKEEK